MQPEDPFVAALHKWIEVSMRRSMRNFILHARECGLSMSQFGALFHLHRMGSSGVSDLGDHLGVTSAAASQMLERLVQQELILRSEDPIDRRVKQIVLTEKGHQVLEVGIRARQSWLEELAGSLSDGEKETITAALNTLIDKANELTQSIEPVR
ncbi:MAG TPA: MarR family transcriptional regulator [Anaerolineales bacterium]|nr:MarR family transcriptional regulator [Anaerolineales bacterium]